MLGVDLERAITNAWLKLRKQILSDPLELRRRLARRRLKTLTRPPRAWCIAIRASDRRITPAHWIITPEHAMDLDHPEHPYEPIEHEVTIQTHAIRLPRHEGDNGGGNLSRSARALRHQPKPIRAGRFNVEQISRTETAGPDQRQPI